MRAMRALQTDFYGDVNIGLFAKACDKLCVLGNNISGKRIGKIQKVLGGKTFQTSLANSELIGIFCALNSNGIVLPKIATQREVEGFREVADGLDMSVSVIGSKFTALGNLILCNDKGAVVSSLIDAKDKKKIEECLGVDSDYGTVAGLDSVGSCGIATNKGCVLHRDASEEELDRVQETLHVDSDIGTANFGSPFVGSCGIANSNGVVTGETTTGPEITRIMEALSLL